MADYAVQLPTLTATAPTSRTTSGGGDSITGVSSGVPLFLRFTNGATTSDVTINDPTSSSPEGANQFDPDVKFTIVSASRIIKINSPARFINPTTGKVDLTYTSVTGLTFEAWQ